MMAYYYYFEVYIQDLTRTKIIDIFTKEEFFIKQKFNHLSLAKNISHSNDSTGYVVLYFGIDMNGNDDIGGTGATIEGEKEEIIDFFKYLLNLAEKEDILFEPIRLFLDEPQSVYIDIESEEDIYAIFDENSPRVKRYSQI